MYLKSNRKILKDLGRGATKIKNSKWDSSYFKMFILANMGGNGYNKQGVNLRAIFDIYIFWTICFTSHESRTPEWQYSSHGRSTGSSSWNQLEMQFLKLLDRPTKSETLGLGSNLCFDKPSR